MFISGWMSTGLSLDQLDDFAYEEVAELMDVPEYLWEYIGRGFEMPWTRKEWFRAGRAFA